MESKIEIMPISSQATQGWVEGSETSLYDLEQIMKSHECVEPYRASRGLRYSPTLQRKLERADKELFNNRCVTELTLCAKNEAANGIIADNTTV